MISGRCYCGATHVSATDQPHVVAYCHCRDCRRITGAPVSAWAAFSQNAVSFSPCEGQPCSPKPGVVRTFCRSCGSTLACRYDYLPGQVYVPVGLLDQADELVPQVHAYEAERLPWLHIADAAERFDQSSRFRLNSTASGDAEK